MTHHIDLTNVTLQQGKHATPEDGVCLLEAVALFAGERHSDHPVCASPVLIAYGIGLNDQWDTATRQHLKPFIPRIVGTAGDGQDEARSFLALDWLIRTYTPAWLDLAGLDAAARSLRDHRRIVDLVAAQSVGPLVRDAAKQSAAAGAAARDAARAAAGDAAWAAAWDAAWDAAGDAARAAARAAVRPTVETLQESALDLFDAMLDPALVTP